MQVFAKATDEATTLNKQDNILAQGDTQKPESEQDQQVNVTKPESKEN